VLASSNLSSLSPEILEPHRRQLGIAPRVLDVAMAEVGLQSAGIMSSIRKRVPTSVPEHMGVRLK
jgi:hypothetical protein